MTQTILIVEDDAPTQMLLETLVQRYGFASATAGDGRTAIELLGARDFAAVVLDLMMPQVSGSDVIDYLARENKRVPVVVCTAAGLDRIKDIDSDLVGAVVRKPFDIEALMATIIDLIRRSETQ